MSLARDFYAVATGGRLLKGRCSGYLLADTPGVPLQLVAREQFAIGKMEGEPFSYGFGRCEEGGTEVGISRFRLAGTNQCPLPENQLAG